MESSGEIPRRGQAGKCSREGRKEPHRERQGGSSRVSQPPAAPCWGAAIWEKQSLGEGGAEGSAAKQGDGRDSGLAENRDWSQETGRERRGRPPTGVGGARWEKDPDPIA